jgi:hypothetical protein
MLKRYARLHKHAKRTGTFKEPKQFQIDRHNGITSIMLKTTAWRRTTLKPIWMSNQDIGCVPAK